MREDTGECLNTARGSLQKKKRRKHATYCMLTPVSWSANEAEAFHGGDNKGEERGSSRLMQSDTGRKRGIFGQGGEKGARERGGKKMKKKKMCA